MSNIFNNQANYVMISDNTMDIDASMLLEDAEIEVVWRTASTEAFRLAEQLRTYETLTESSLITEHNMHEPAKATQLEFSIQVSLALKMNLLRLRHYLTHLQQSALALVTRNCIPGVEQKDHYEWLEVLIADSEGPFRGLYMFHMLMIEHWGQSCYPKVTKDGYYRQSLQDFLRSTTQPAQAWMLYSENDIDFEQVKGETAH